MKHAMKEWNDIAALLRGKTVLIFLDFDGTLAPIASTPSRACLRAQTRNTLLKLNSQRNIRLAIISGRDLDDIRNMVAIPDTIYAGNHGHRISGPGFEWLHSFPAIWHKKLKKLHQELSAGLNGIQGIYIESKAMSVTVHYRKVKPRDMAKTHELLTRISWSHIKSSFITPSIGKKVVELSLATSWNKGRAVNWIIHRLKHSDKVKSPISIYIGDDVTDETAFKTLKDKGVTIHVGIDNQSVASYYLRNPSEVSGFLLRLSALSNDNSLMQRTGIGKSS